MQNFLYICIVKLQKKVDKIKLYSWKQPTLSNKCAIMETAITYIAITPDKLNNLLQQASETALTEYQNKQDKETFYTTKEVADMLRVNPATVKRYIVSGALKAALFKTYIISKYNLNQFIKTKTMPCKA